MFINFFDNFFKKSPLQAANSGPFDLVAEILVGGWKRRWCLEIEKDLSYRHTKESEHDIFWLIFMVPIVPIPVVAILHIFIKNICGISEKNKIIITIWQL